MTQEALRMAIDFIEDVNFGEWRGSTERQENVITAIKEALAQEKALQALHDENERLGLYKDAYAQPKPQIKTTDPFESSRVGDYNRGWNDCLFASGIVKQPEQEPRNVRERWNVELDGNDLLVCFNDHEKGDKCQYERYSPQRTWVGLTEEEIDDLRDNNFGVSPLISAVEAKLKERNT